VRSISVSACREVQAAAVSTAIARALPLKEALGVIRSGGFTCVELGYQHLSEPASVATAVQAAASEQIKVTSVHLPFIGLDISHPDERTRRDVCSLLASYLESCAEQDVSLLVIHPNSYAVAVDVADWERRNRQSARSLAELGDLATALDVRLALENQPTRDLRAGGNISELQQVIERLQCDHLGLCVDTVHASYNGLDAAAQIEQAGSQLWAVHLADDEGQKHLHAVPGDGALNWDQIMGSLSACGYSGYYTMEVYGPRASKNLDQQELLVQNHEIVERLAAAWRRLRNC